MKMKVIVIAAVLAASIAGSASATIDMCVNITSPAGNSPVRVFKFDETKVRGEIVVYGCIGLCDWEIDGLPPWLRQVRTNVGYDLIGRPQVGTYNIEYKGVVGRVSANVPPDPNWIGILHTKQTWIFKPGYRILEECGPIPKNYHPW